MNKLKKAVLLLTGLCILESAQAADFVLPGSAQPERVGQSLSAPTLQPQAPTALPTTPTAPQTALGPEAEKIQFKLNEIIIENAHIYSDKQLRPLYQNQLDTTISVAELQAIVQRITNYYRNNGYILSRAVLPPQRISNGIVHIQIIEGFIEQVNVTGNPKGAKTLVEQYGKNIGDEKSLQINTLEHYINLANNIPGATVNAVLEPSKTSFGASDLNLDTQLKTFDGFISYDNYGSRYTGPTELTAGAAVNSIFRSGDKTQVTIAGSNQDAAMRYIDLSHDTPLDSTGTRLIVGGNYTETQPGFILSQFDTAGRAKNAYVIIQHPFTISRTQNFTLQGGFNYLDSNVNTGEIQLYTDHIRTVNIGGNYNFSDGWQGANLVGLTVTQGLNVLGATQDDDINISRVDGKSVFTKFNLQASRTQALLSNFSAYALVQGQYTAVPLLASEQFGFGGQQVGRGYDPSEIIGDKGLDGTVELRMDVATAKSMLQAMQFYTFYDAGLIWNNNTTNQPGRASAASTGVGVRLFFTQSLSGNLLLAKPLTKPVAAEDITGNGKAPRAYFGITAAI